LTYIGYEDRSGIFRNEEKCVHFGHLTVSRAGNDDMAGTELSAPEHACFDRDNKPNKESRNRIVAYPEKLERCHTEGANCVKSVRNETLEAREVM
jgi:hypothetical protein